MKTFNTKINPYIKTKNDTHNIMRNILISLIPLIVYGGYQFGITYLLNIFACAVVTSVIEIVYLAIFKKSNLWSNIKNSYVYLPGLLFGMIMPVGLPLETLLIGASIVSLAKVLFGGFGKYFFNQVAIGFIIISIISNYHSFNKLGYLKGYFVAGSISNIMIVLLLISFIYLVVTKAIKWRITLSYLLIFAIMTFFTGLYVGCSINGALVYTTIGILSDTLIFASIYLATDSTTSPMTNGGEIIYGMLLGIITVILHYYTDLNSVQYYAILFMNLFVPVINNLGAKGRFNKEKIVTPIVLVWILMAITTVIIGYSVNHNRVSINKVGMFIYEHTKR